MPVICPTLSPGLLSLPLSQGAMERRIPRLCGKSIFSSQGSRNQSMAGLGQDPHSARQPLLSGKTPFHTPASPPHALLCTIGWSLSDGINCSLQHGKWGKDTGRKKGQVEKTPFNTSPLHHVITPTPNSCSEYTEQPTAFAGAVPTAASSCLCFRNTQSPTQSH